MANPILIKRSAVASKTPQTTDLQLGELAINTYDGKLYLKKNNGTESIIEVGAQGAGAVQSVAGKTGVVTLNSSDVGLANVENKSSATIRGELTASNVTTALTFTPYNSTNPNNYISANQTITVSGDASGTGTNAIALTLANSGVTAGTYKSVTVDVKGRVTAGSASANLASSDVTTALGYTPYNGTTNTLGFLTANQSIAVTGDATGTGTNAITLTLGNSGVSAGTYTKVTVDAKGRATAGSNPTTLSGYGITDALNSVSGGSVAGNITLTGGAKITGLSTPTAGGDATSKTYVDGAVAAVAVGTSWRLNAQVASVANLTLSGTQTIDGYAAVVGDRVLVKDQTDQTENGVYVVASGAWTRATDTDTGTELVGMAILVLNGSTNPLSQWINTNTGTITVGTTNITYTKLQGNGVVYTSGTGLTLSGNVFSITNTGVTAGTFSKVTVNAQGQVSAGANIASSDITTALGYTPYNSTNPNNYLTANQTVTVSGDATGSGANAIALTLANSGVTAGTYKSVTVDVKGRVTAGSNPTTLAGYGITDAISSSGLTTTLTLSGGGLITGVPTPTNASDASNKSYVDTSFNNFQVKTVVAAASAGSNLSSSGGLLIVDGYQTVAGDRVLAKDQTDATTNGIWIVAAGAWSRATDAISSLQVKNAVITVLNGTVNARTQWMNTNTGAVTVSTTALTYAQIFGAAGATTLSGDVTGSGTGAVTTTLANSGVAAGTYSKVTVDVKGRVTAGAAIASSDVTTALTYTPANKAGDTFTGAVNEAAVVTLASAGTVNIGAAAANTINVSGTTTITAFDTIAAGAIRRVVFAGALTLTHNATSLILPTGANIVTAGGEVAEFVSLGSGNWRCTYYTKANNAFATLSGAETLTNKTLVNPSITNFTETGATASGTTYTVDLTNGTDFEITTTGNLTITLPAAAAGKSYTVTVVYGGTHTVTFAGGTSIAYSGGVAPVATSVSGKTDVYVMKCNRAGTKTFVNDGGRNY